MSNTSRLSLVALAGALAACGGAPAPSPAPTLGALVVDHAAGGRALDLCVAGDQLFVLEPFTLQVWRVADRPELVEQRRLARPAARLACQGDPPGPDAVVVDAERSGNLPGHVAALRPHGWQIAGDAGPVLVRATPGATLASAFTEGALWAIDGEALWRWVPGPGRPLRVELPPALVDQPVESLFFEGPVLWVRVAPDQGHPLAVDGPVAEYVKPAGKLGPFATGPILLPVAGKFVRLEIGSPRATVDDTPWTVPAPTAVMPWADGLVIAHGEGLGWWSFAGGAPRLVAELPLSGTQALYDAGEHLVAVGDYGYVAITRSSATPRTPPSAP